MFSPILWRAVRSWSVAKLIPAPRPHLREPESHLDLGFKTPLFVRFGRPGRERLDLALWIMTCVSLIEAGTRHEPVLRAARPRRGSPPAGLVQRSCARLVIRDGTRSETRMPIVST